MGFWNNIGHGNFGGAISDVGSNPLSYAAPLTGLTDTLTGGNAGSFIDNKFLGGDAARAARQAGQTQQDVATRAGQNVQNQFTQTQSTYQPYIDSGAKNLGILNNGLASGQFDQGKFSFDPSQVQNDPGYQFAMQQEIKGADQGAAARGGVLGGGQQKALTTLAGGIASQYENQDYNHAAQTYLTNQTNLNNQFGRYSQLAGMGQTAVGQLGALGGQNAQTQADLYTGGAAANAAGQVGAANARATAVNGLLGIGGKLGAAALS